MISHTIALSLALLSLVSQSMQSNETHHHVTVSGGARPFFTPAQVNANIGDVIQFEFGNPYEKLSQSSLEHPCSPVNSDLSRPDPNGLAYQTTLAIKTSGPLWYYLQESQPHAQCNERIVFAVNPGSRMDEFQENARSSDGITRKPAWESQARRAYTTAAPTTGPSSHAGPSSHGPSSHTISSRGPTKSRTPVTSNPNTTSQTIVVLTTTKTITDYVTDYETVFEPSATFGPTTTPLASSNGNINRRFISALSLGFIISAVFMIFL